MNLEQIHDFCEIMTDISRRFLLPIFVHKLFFPLLRHFHFPRRGQDRDVEISFSLRRYINQTNLSRDLTAGQTLAGVRKRPKAVVAITRQEAPLLSVVDLPRGVHC